MCMYSFSNICVCLYNRMHNISLYEGQFICFCHRRTLCSQILFVLLQTASRSMFLHEFSSFYLWLKIYCETYMQEYMKHVCKVYSLKSNTMTICQSKFGLKKYNITGAPGRRLGWAVGWAAGSWFPRRSWSQGGEIEPQVWLRAQQGICLKDSLSPSSSVPPRSCVLSL